MVAAMARDDARPPRGRPDLAQAARGLRAGDRLHPLRVAGRRRTGQGWRRRTVAAAPAGVRATPARQRPVELRRRDGRVHPPVRRWRGPGLRADPRARPGDPVRGRVRGRLAGRDPARRIHAVLTVTTPVQQAREALGARLREIRKDADLTARALAAAMGSHFTKVSKIENGARSPTEQDIRSWCTACGAAGQIPDLIATVRHIEAMYHEYRRQMQAGLKHLTESSVPLYEQTSLFRIYDTTVVPGLFTTAEYAAALFRFWAGFMGLADEVDAAVQARMDRQRVLYTGEREFRVVVEEQVLRTRVGDADVMAGQLDRLLAVMSLPRVRIGIIPAAGERHSLTQGSFWMFDDSRVRVETVSASLNITQPRDIALYARVFELLQQSALYGRDARRLIGRALRDLDSRSG